MAASSGNALKLILPIKIWSPWQKRADKQWQQKLCLKEVIGELCTLQITVTPKQNSVSYRLRKLIDFKLNGGDQEELANAHGNEGNTEELQDFHLEV